MNHLNIIVSMIHAIVLWYCQGGRLRIVSTVVLHVDELVLELSGFN